MIFTTWPFFVFMSVVFVVYWWLVPRRGRPIFLLAASLAYFTYNYPPYTLLLGALTLATYACGVLIARHRDDPSGRTPARAAYVVGIVLAAGTLVLFKYSHMLAATATAVCCLWIPAASLTVPNLLVPLGISFFTFEFVHYLTDVYLGKIRTTSLLHYSLFAFFFPGLASGPIKRFSIFQDQTDALDRFRPSYLDEGLRRIAFGIAKKVVIADTASILTTPLAHPSSASRTALWLAMYAYSVKIYYDFSGYTDIAIGCARLLGYRLPENFNRPYRQSNLSRFWNNWHMSLSSWIRDYLFIPLGGSRVGKFRVFLNLTLVMTICGFWHGANWNFVVWGLWHGLGLAAVRVYRGVGNRIPDARAVRWIGTAVTYQFVCFGWVLFASPNLPTALISLRSMLVG